MENKPPIFTTYDEKAIIEAVKAEGISFRQYIQVNSAAHRDYIYTELKKDEIEEVEEGEEGELDVVVYQGLPTPSQPGKALNRARMESLLMAMGWLCLDTANPAPEAPPKEEEPEGEPNLIACVKDGRGYDFDRIKKEFQKIHTSDQLKYEYNNLVSRTHPSPKQEEVLRKLCTDREEELEWEDAA